MEFAPPILGYVVLFVALLAVVRLERSGSLTRNSTIGIRTRRTMSSDEAWHVGHRAAAPCLVAAAAVSALFAVALAVVMMSGVSASLGDVLAVSGFVVVGAIIVLGAVVANRAVDGRCGTDF